MSKIYDALRKAAGEPPEPKGTPPVPEPADRQAPALPPAPAGQPPEGNGRRFVETARGGNGLGSIPPLSEAFSREMSHLRASIEQSVPDRSQRVILITATVPGEGASTVAARFAQFLAEDERLRVALVDADLRNADRRTVETADVGGGFASVLTGEIDPADAFRPTGLGGLDVLPGEGVHADPYALCTARQFEQLLAHLRTRYHYSILDGAPILNAPETAVLGGMVDGVVLVVRAGKTKREVIHRGLDQLRKYKARVLGVVMNRQQYVIPGFIYRRL